MRIPTTVSKFDKNSHCITHSVFYSIYTRQEVYWCIVTSLMIQYALVKVLSAPLNLVPNPCLNTEPHYTLVRGIQGSPSYSRKESLSHHHSSTWRVDIQERLRNTPPLSKTSRCLEKSSQEPPWTTLIRRAHQQQNLYRDDRIHRCTHHTCQSQQYRLDN